MLMGSAYWFAVRFHYPVEEVFQLKRLWVTFKDASLAFTLPVIILGGIFGGFVTATEGAALALSPTGIWIHSLLGIFKGIFAIACSATIGIPVCPKPQ